MYLKLQRAMGVVLLVMAIIAVRFVEDGIGIAVIFVPMGIALLATKQNVLYNGNKSDVNRKI